MSEDLQNKLIQWFERLGDIASEQLPDFAQQIVSYHIWDHTIWMYSLMAVACFFFLLGIIFFIASFSDIKDESEACMISFVVMLFVSVVLFFCSMNQYTEIKKGEHAPKLVILDYIKGRR